MQVSALGQRGHVGVLARRRHAFVDLANAPPLVRTPAVPLPYVGLPPWDADALPPLVPVTPPPPQAGPDVFEHKMF